MKEESQVLFNKFLIGLPDRGEAEVEENHRKKIEGVTASSSELFTEWRFESEQMIRENPLFSPSSLTKVHMSSVSAGFSLDFRCRVWLVYSTNGLQSHWNTISYHLFLNSYRM